MNAELIIQLVIVSILVIAIIGIGTLCAYKLSIADGCSDREKEFVVFTAFLMGSLTLGLVSLCMIIFWAASKIKLPKFTK